MKYIFLALSFFISGYVSAADSARQVTIAKIIEAQGLEQMFRQQIDQSKSQARELGEDIYRKVLQEFDIVGEQKNQKVEQVFAQYLERCSTMFSAKEYVEIWTRFYGKNLSEEELKKILAYYTSSAGQKDVAASKEAMVGFSQTVGIEMQQRLSNSIKQLTVDLKAAIKATTNSPVKAEAAQ